MFCLLESPIEVIRPYTPLDPRVNKPTVQCQHHGPCLILPCSEPWPLSPVSKGLVETVLTCHPRDKKMWSLKTDSLITCVICIEKCTLRIVKWRSVNPGGLNDRFIVLLTILPSLLICKKLLSYLFLKQNISHCGLWPILLCGWDVQCRECIFSGAQQVQHWWHWHHDLSENSSSSTYRLHWQVIQYGFLSMVWHSKSKYSWIIVYHTTDHGSHF